MLRLFRPTKPLVSTEDTNSPPISIQFGHSRRVPNKQKRLSTTHSPNNKKSKSSSKKKGKKIWRLKRKQKHQLLNSDQHGNNKSHQLESDECTANTSEMTASLVSSRTGLSSLKSSRTALSTSNSSMKHSDATNIVSVGESSLKTENSSSKPQHHYEQSESKIARRELKVDSAEFGSKNNILQQVQNDSHNMSLSENKIKDNNHPSSPRKKQRSKRPLALSQHDERSHGSHHTSFSTNSVVSPHASLKDLMKAKYYMRYELDNKIERPDLDEQRVPLTVTIGPQSNAVGTDQQQQKRYATKENDTRNQNREHGPIDVDDYYEEMQQQQEPQSKGPMKAQLPLQNVSSVISLHPSPVSTARNLVLNSFDSGSNELKSSTKWIDRSLIKSSNNSNGQKSLVSPDIETGLESRLDETKSVQSIPAYEKFKPNPVQEKSITDKSYLKSSLPLESNIPSKQPIKEKVKKSGRIEDITSDIEIRNDSFQAAFEEESSRDETVAKAIHNARQKSGLEFGAINEKSHRTKKQGNVTKIQEGNEPVASTDNTDNHLVVEKSVIKRPEGSKEDIFSLQSSNSIQKSNVVNVINNDQSKEVSYLSQSILKAEGKKRRKDELDALLSSLNDIEKKLMIEDMKTEKEKQNYDFCMISNLHIVEDGIKNLIHGSEGSEKATISSSSSFSDFNSTGSDSTTNFKINEKISRESVVMKKRADTPPLSLSDFFESDFGDFEELHSNNSFDELSILDSLIGDSLSVEESSSDLTRRDTPWISNKLFASIKTNSEGSCTSSLDPDFEDFMKECDEEDDFHKSLQSSTYEITPIVEGDEEESDLSTILSKEKFDYTTIKGTPHTATAYYALTARHTETSKEIKKSIKTESISSTKICRGVKRQVSWKEEPEVWCYKQYCEDEITKGDSVGESSSGNKDISEDASTPVRQIENNAPSLTHDMIIVPLQVTTSQEESDLSSESELHISTSSSTGSITSQTSTYSYSSEASESVKYMVNKLKDETERKKRKQRLRIGLIQTTIQSTTIQVSVVDANHKYK